MINEVRFMYRLSLPPKHSDYPSIALLHGMCAVAYTIGSFDGSGASDYWRQDNDEEITSPALYHAKKAKRYFETSIEKGEKLFDLCQAVVLLNFFSYTHARFVEVSCALCSLITDEGTLGLDQHWSRGAIGHPTWAQVSRLLLVESFMSWAVIWKHHTPIRTANCQLIPERCQVTLRNTPRNTSDSLADKVA